ncbi:MAG: Calx-beta domain-containing protein [Cyanobacteria bacterium J06629_2]
MRISGETLEIIPTLSVEPIEVLEGELARFSLELDSAASVDVSFDYSTQDLEAIAGADYVVNSGSVVIPAGETTAVVEIETKQDNLYNENSESFVLKITELTGATFADNATEYTVAAEIANQERDEPMNLAGTSGNDTLVGGAGSDRLLESGNVDFVLTDTSLTGLGVDSLDSIELANLYGRGGDNLIDATGANNIATVIKGDAGNNTLMGSQMSDSIFGGSGNDFLYGSSGDDTLIGNSGADVFVLESAAGMDTIQDFEDGIDSFGLTSLSFGDLSISNNQAGTGVLIADASNNQVLATVNNVTAAEIMAEDFMSMSI